MENKDLHLLSTENSILLNYLAQIRDANIQKDRMRFRTNIQRISRIMAYEISKSLEYEEHEVTTVLGSKNTRSLTNTPVLISVMRAALPMHEGFLEVFEEADNTFIGAARSNLDSHYQFEIDLHYMASPDLEGRTLILCDPMLATGKSVVKAVETLKQYGSWSELYIASIIASRAGVDYVQKSVPSARIWLADCDPELNDKSYIVPGLGDAGDLAFGPKL